MQPPPPAHSQETITTPILLGTPAAPPPRAKRASFFHASHILAAITLALLLPAIPTHAASAHTASPTTPWQGGMISNGSDSYCAIESSFSNGLTLSLAQDRTGAITMAMLVQGIKSAKVGKAWPVTIIVNGNTKSTTAQVADSSEAGTIIAMPYGTVADDLARLSTAAMISIVTKSDRADFETYGLGKALPALTACASTIPASQKQ